MRQPRKFAAKASPTSGSSPPARSICAIAASTATSRLPWPADDDFAAAFAAEHRQRYGYAHDGRPLEIVAARVEVVGSRGERPACQQPGIANAQPQADQHDALLLRRPTAGRAGVRAHRACRRATASPARRSSANRCRRRSSIPAGRPKSSPAANCCSPMRATVSAERSSIAIIDPQSADPVLLEIFNNLLASIAEQMGVTLRNTASSVNVKERLDFSCAIFTADGRLVVNAPHVPVHLGAMGETVRRIIADNPDLQPGDVFVTNDPYAGGSHLPDVTVVTPVHDAAGELLFFTASRAHHAEIGGIAPGSMPPFSKNLARRRRADSQLRDRRRAASRGSTSCERCSRPAAIRRATSRRIWPTSRPKSRPTGKARTILSRSSSAIRGRSSTAYMEHVQDAAEQKVRQALARLPAGTHAFTDYLETPTAKRADRGPLYDPRSGRAAGRDDRLHRHRPGRRRATSTPTGRSSRRR